MRYIGRFAPSPTGPLHQGSLVTAAASYLQARQNSGHWLVRIEDIDPPREVPGAAAGILRTLERLRLLWDGPVLFQSTRREVYESIAQQLLRDGSAYRCSCTRSELRLVGSAGNRPGRYPGTCRERHLPDSDTAIRVRAPREPVRFDDSLQGPQSCDVDASHGDFLIYRRDGLPSYHLAVVVDDAEQRISHVVRGVDLLDSTPIHIHLQSTLGLGTPAYAHVPIIVNARGQKLSKQTGAIGVDLKEPEQAVLAVLDYLGLEPPRDLRGSALDELWSWATANWVPNALAGCRTLPPRGDGIAEPAPID